MEIKLDLKDKRILHELDSNCRTPSTKIAKRVGLTPEGVNYRIKRLEKENIITQYQIIVNLSKLNILQFKICLSLQHLKNSELEKIISELNKKDSIKWIVSCRGNWDLIISAETDTLENIDKTKKEILEHFGNHIREKAVSILIEAETYNRNYLLDEKNPQNKRTIMKKDSIPKIDKLDLSILKELSKNARTPLIEISEKLKSTPRIINYRISQMEKNKIILGYKIAINYEKLKIKFYKIFVHLENSNTEKEKALTKYFLTHQNIIHNVKVISDWDYEPEFEVFSEEEFDIFLKEMKDKFSDIISRIDVITISKEHKFVYF